MNHPHEYLLQEFKISIDRLVPLTPHDIVEEANSLYERLQLDDKTSERQIRQALIEIGKKEFPYRKAYEELCAQDEERRLQEAALAKLEPEVKAKIEVMTNSGVHILEYVKSRLFEEQLNSTERFKVETAILEAHDVINRQCDERAQERKTRYEDLVKQWSEYLERVSKKIEALKAMAERSSLRRSEILDKALTFEEGWSIVERDPVESEVDEELKEWALALDGEEEGEEDSLSFQA